MRKIPTLFIRNERDRRYVIPEVHPDCLWVLDGEGTATRKFDGTCVQLTREGLWWARREVKPGKQAPANYVPEQLDKVTGKIVGWEPIEQSAFAKYHAEALGYQHEHRHVGTYELCGPKVNGNPEGFDRHILIRHADAEVLDAPRDFDGLAKWLADFEGEGIVWHNKDGRMAKLKRRDFPGAK